VVLNRFVASLHHVVSVAVGNAHSCALFSNGQISCWGSNDFGQLGDGTRTDSATPRAVGGIATAVALSTTADHNCALLAGGAVLCWGRNDFGQAAGTLGGDKLVATPVAGIAAWRCGRRHDGLATQLHPDRQRSRAVLGPQRERPAR
jgi:alpha-tubulin suppressor-like RCC1 family protein